MSKTKSLIIPEERIVNKIYFIREQKVMFDFDLAELYQVKTKVLNQSVKRNKSRFPADFVFQLAEDEFNVWQQYILRSQIVTSKNHQASRSQIVTLNKERGQNIKYLPYVFTEQGVAMLSSVLRSEIAIKINIAIIRTFTKLRQIIATNKELQEKLQKIEDRLFEHDRQLSQAFELIKRIIDIKQKDESDGDMGFRLEK